jgi:hypothetical protein
MTILSVFDIGLVVLTLGIGASTIAAREASAAVIGFVVYGFLLPNRGIHPDRSGFFPINARARHRHHMAGRLSAVADCGLP